MYLATGQLAVSFFLFFLYSQRSRLCAFFLFFRYSQRPVQSVAPSPPLAFLQMQKTEATKKKEVAKVLFFTSKEDCGEPFQKLRRNHEDRGTRPLQRPRGFNGNPPHPFEYIAYSGADVPRCPEPFFFFVPGGEDRRHERTKRYRKSRSSLRTTSRKMRRRLDLKNY